MILIGIKNVFIFSKTFTFLIIIMIDLIPSPFMTFNSEMIISCKCGCDDGLRIKIEKDEEDYCFMTYLSGNWYKEQAGFIKKLKKIWAIIRNKDFYYSEIILNKKDWEEYKKWINEK